MSFTAQRDLAVHTAPRDFCKALALARKTGSPWFRCQALAWVARFAPEPEVVGVAEEAFSIAFTADDPYQTVGASSWPARALIERGHQRQMARWLPKLLSASQSIQHPVSRLDALYLLWQAVYPSGEKHSKDLLEALLSACLSADSWKAGWTMREITLVLVDGGMSDVSRLIASMPEGPFKRQAERRTAEHRPGHIRSFFWQG